MILKFEMRSVHTKLTLDCLVPMPNIKNQIIQPKAVKFASNALNEFNWNTNFSPRTIVFF